MTKCPDTIDRVSTVSAGSLAQAYAACEALARSHYENFPVASMLVPEAMFIRYIPAAFIFIRSCRAASSGSNVHVIRRMPWAMA